MNSIKNYINNVRLQLALTQLKLGLINVILLLICLFFSVILIESIFYLENYYRQKIVEVFFTLSFVTISYNIFRYVINRNKFFGNMNDEDIARFIGNKSELISDKILNVLQLENNKLIGSNDSSLIKLAVQRMKSKLDEIPINVINEEIPKKKIFGTLFIIIILFSIYTIQFKTLASATTRILNPNQDFPVPKPFSLISLSGNQRVLGGDTLLISIAAVGEIPDSLELIWFDKEKKHKKKIGVYEDIYKHTFKNINSDIIYWMQYQNKSFLSSFRTIESTKDTITVRDRPIIQNIEFTIVPPNYTKEEIYIHPGNITDINALEGSKINISASASKSLSKAWILTNDGRIYLNIDDKKILGDFVLSSDQELSYWCLDRNMVANSNPPLYRFSIIKDLSPEIIIFSPEREIDINERMIIDFNMQIIDDYGISNVWIEYEIIHPDYLKQDTTEYIYMIENIDNELKSQQIKFSWDISSLSLGPEDEIHYYINVEDNNDFSGASVTTSPLYIARYPSLDNLFSDLEETEEILETEALDMKMNLEDIKELMEDLELELLKSDEMSWENVKKVEETLEKMDNIQEQIEEIKEQFEMINEMADQNQLVSPELMEKFDQLQNLLSEIMTPEMLEAMEKMQEAMDSMDPEQMLEAMKDFEFDAEAMEEQIDRFMEMFQQAMAEQKMDELAKRLEQMFKDQSKIMQDLNEKTESMNELASRERRLEENFDKIEDSMKDAISSVQKFSPQTAEDLQNLKDSDLTNETSQELTDARQAMQKQDFKNSMGSGKKAQENLEDLVGKVNDIQKLYQNQTVAEMMNLFQRLVNGVLKLSQDQEKMIIESKTLKSRSPRLVEMAVNQGKIRSQTNQAIEQLMDLSRKTFHISPKISRSMGKARGSMDKAIAQYEQRQVSSGRKSQSSAIEGLNEAANLMMSSMDMMQETGSASGFESFMESLSEMSSQQQGINNQTMQMQMGMGMQNQQGMMQRLQAQQQQLQQALQDLLSENPGEESGGLGKAKQDMDDVIEDFKRKKIDRQTMDRQEKILSRMLDAQKSMSQRDYSEKRKSKKGESIIYDGPAGLPEDYGNRKILLIEAMEDALDEGHTKENQKMIKTYFRELQKIEDNNDE